MCEIKIILRQSCRKSRSATVLYNSINKEYHYCSSLLPVTVVERQENKAGTILVHVNWDHHTSVSSIRSRIIIVKTCCKLNYAYIHCVSKKVPTLKLSVTLSNLNHFLNFCTAGKRMKFATKPIRHYPPHPRHVATLPWETENSNFLQIFSRHERKCKQVAFLSPLTLLLIHKF